MDQEHSHRVRQRHPSPHQVPKTHLGSRLNCIQRCWITPLFQIQEHLWTMILVMVLQHDAASRGQSIVGPAPDLWLQNQGQAPRCQADALWLSMSVWITLMGDQASISMCPRNDPQCLEMHILQEVLEWRRRSEWGLIYKVPLWDPHCLIGECLMSTSSCGQRIAK